MYRTARELCDRDYSPEPCHLRTSPTCEGGGIHTRNALSGGLEGFALHLERVKARTDADGHSASEATLRRIHDASLGNLRRAIEYMDELWVYDNSKVGGPPQMVMEAKAGGIVFSERSSAYLARGDVRLVKSLTRVANANCRPETGGQNQQIPQSPVRTRVWSMQRVGAWNLFVSK